MVYDNPEKSKRSCSRRAEYTVQYSNNTLCHKTDVISMTGTLSLYPSSITTGDVKGIAEWFADAS